ncbi:MAG: uroporphyrinogen-III C-methyltransferase [Oscillospiraceae bacterium]|nr:uroporphyrinogen-III C-methyltransferase [Oscillospiraceae bacterium]
MSLGCVYLVGAGCGAADLITARGLRLLRSCDAAVYDDLIDPALLDEIPANAETVYMGKRRGAHSVSQAEITALLIAKAREGKTVVRLKGGDPFVFGRGGEELLALRQAGIPCEEVPGVTSAIAIPAEAGIPVTHRGVSRSVHIVTAHTAGTPDGLPPGLEALARLEEGTLVFLMGLHQLPRLTERLLAAGKPSDTPAAVISGGNAPHPMAVRGTLADIAEKARDVRPPAVVVIGETAAMDVSSTVPRPLAGITVGLTGTDAVADKLRPALEALGARTFPAERSRVERLPVSAALDALYGGDRQWLVFTSANGVRLFFETLAEERIDLRRLYACKFAVIGAATAAALESHGIRADLCPETFTTAALAHALLDTVPAGEPVWLFRSAHGSPALAGALVEKYPVRDVPLYRLSADPDISAWARQRLDAMDFLAFSSASGVELYFAAHKAVPEGTTCVCIGEVTAAALRRRYPKPFLTAAEISIRGIVDVISAQVRINQERQ